MTIRIAILVLLLSLAGCRSAVPDKSSTDLAPAVRSFYVGLAAVEVGDDVRAAQELTRVTELAPGEPAGWNNLGVLQLRQKDLESAAKSFDRARSIAGDSAVVYSNLAILENQRGNAETAIGHLNRTIELAPGDLRAVYLLAAEKERQTLDAEALALFERIAAARPGNLAARLEIARLAGKTGDRAKLEQAIDEIGKGAGGFSAEAKEQFGALNAARTNPRQAATQVSFLRNVLLREAPFRAAIAEFKPSDTAIGELIRRPLKLPAPDFTAAEPDTAVRFTVAESGAVKANFAAGLFLNGTDAPVRAWSDGRMTMIGIRELQVRTRRAAEIAAFDFDYDFLNDVAVAGAAGFRLFRQVEGGDFSDVTAAAKLPPEMLMRPYAGVWTLDAENDGDLDLVLAPESGAPFVLQNNSDGSFAPLAPFALAGPARGFVWADLDEDGDSDAFILDANGSVTEFSNERGGLFMPKAISTAGQVSAIAVGDATADGRLDLVIADRNGTVTALTEAGGGAWTATGLFKASGAADALFVTDLDNNGANDVLVSGAASSVFLGAPGGSFAPAAEPVAGRVSGAADANGDGRLDLFGTDSNGMPALFVNSGSRTYRWQIFRPRAAKTEGDQRVNTFGIGGEMEIRSGVLAQKRIIGSPQVHFGLGSSETTDILRVVWGNGYVQAEFDLKPDQTVAAEQRLKGSCPHLFAWDGERFVMVKDAPPWSPALGLKINAQDTYGVLQTEEWFRIPGRQLKPRDGFYELRITGEYWETFYLDSYRLLAVDHPDSVEVFTDERFSIPLPPLKVFATERTRRFASMTDHKGNDAAEAVSELDERYLDSIERGRFQGVAKEHWVEFDLPESAPRDRRIWLVGDGWMHPTDASINVQRGQIPGVKPPRSLTLEVQQPDGTWRVDKENLGFPAGKMKTVLIELPPSGRRFRLRTELEIFWDRLAWGIEAGDGAKNETPISLASSELRYRGFSVIEKRDDSSPEKPVYDRILTTGQRWRDLEGYYTRFGDVTELLAGTDDRIVLMNAGDELVLKFAALPDPPPGWKRDFVIVGNGWIKDGDLNSVFSKTVLPLPTRATNDYTRPPSRLEDDPVFRRNSEDWKRFHTRYVAPDDFRTAVRTAGR